VRTIALLTFKECHRRAFPYVAAPAVALLALASHLFQVFSFGSVRDESVNLAISAVFLAGLLHAAFVGTALVRQDLERGTLGLILTKPLGAASYLGGRLVGAALSALVLCAMVAGAVALIFLLRIGPRVDHFFSVELLAGWSRTLLPILVLEAAALAASAITSRLIAPALLVTLFVAGSLVGTGGLGLVLPDFSLFGLEVGAAPPLGVLLVYSSIHVGIFYLVALLVLGARAPIRSQG
jgi:hypothetical protein